ncbi:hypothetical protein GP486_003909 [Trichoglossum hirsutum]|uniref:Uncharacterized protein n=1 Tax=Trichoglossum hirsutum TaxID=265104 RepID=A0A9P8RPZ0_9PEZI|nr:hypothetical protein GP486_003909 [Trichoglossum hirsutum]
MSNEISVPNTGSSKTSSASKSSDIKVARLADNTIEISRKSGLNGLGALPNPNTHPESNVVYHDLGWCFGALREPLKDIQSVHILKFSGRDILELPNPY